ncbi:MAG: class I SAM-dependent methyltransferase [Alphaproteobacteria bacterium]|nr:class I SAM-dependent methyltransferase [Alphaproteobacteria bacterium]
MKPSVQRIYKWFWQKSKHPYRVLEETLDGLASPGRTFVDSGCGYEAPVLAKLKGRGLRLIGLDVVDFRNTDPELDLKRADIGHLPLADASVDVIYSRSVMEHVTQPEAVIAEAFRVLKPGGHMIFLTANKWDYASIIARLVPNRYHGRIVRFTEGRDEADVFPTAYRANTRHAVRRLAHQTGFDIERVDFLGQYPSYFTFSAPLFFLASLYEKLIIAVPAFKFVRGWLFVVLRKPAT